MRNFLLVLGVLAGLSQPARSQTDDRDQLRVGALPDGRILVPTNQILKPAGTQTTFPGRPVDLAFLEGGSLVVAKSIAELVFMDAATGKIRQRLATPRVGREQTGFSVVGLVTRGNRVFASDAKSEVRIAQRQASGAYAWTGTIRVEAPAVKGEAHPAGMALLDNDHLWVTSTRGNNVQLIDLTTGKVEQVVAVGVAPFMVVCPTTARCFVTNWGGDLPAAGAQQAVSSKSPIQVDSRTRIANDGSVSVLEKVDGRWKQVRTIKVGLHPSGMIADAAGRLLYIANANSDTVSVIDAGTLEVVETIACRPEARLPFGSGSNALALDAAGTRLHVANGTNNCVAVVELGSRGQKSRLLGMIPTGWYPGAILASGDGKQLIVANIKGHGSLNQPRPVAQGRRTHDHLGSVSFIPIPDAAQLAAYTKEVAGNNREAYSLAGLEKPR
ncbi:MAG TPA: hypothetical protein VGP68_23725, partial [Gemmataceae bacterium]|nr:hypothetical protein [Gemmataceae bacterium]